MTREERARNIRVAAAELAVARPHPQHKANRDEQRYRREDGQPSYLASFTKGLKHCENTGLIENPDHYQRFVRAIDSGDRHDFRETPLGNERANTNVPFTWKSNIANHPTFGSKTVAVRGWESQGAGLTFDLEGPDAQAVTMPPAPHVGSDELTAEMAEVYGQALLRDIPFTTIVGGAGPSHHNQKVQDILDLLNDLAWFDGRPLHNVTREALARRRPQLVRQTAFRGITFGDDVGPYISQFLLAGNGGINKFDMIHEPAQGYITYGGIRVDQRVRVAEAIDYMKMWDEWLDVQNGADLRGQEDYVTNPECAYRFITTPRDLATYVHYDALYEAYLNACLLMLAKGIPFDPGIPFQQFEGDQYLKGDEVDHQQGFAHFGGPHILSLVTEVATRALKAVRYQKFNVHRRLRPEALAGRLEKSAELSGQAPALQEMVDEFQRIGLFDANQNLKGHSNRLLPMAFPEGSPMHPSYGAGHATVAGACVTILKAFFDHAHPLALVEDRDEKGDKQFRADLAFVPVLRGEEGIRSRGERCIIATYDGQLLRTVPVLDTEGRRVKLTVEGELNKLASNISIGRDWAGVHYFSDYIESIRLGEQIALGILEEQKLTYGENFSMTVPLFDGGTVRI